MLLSFEYCTTIHGSWLHPILLLTIVLAHVLPLSSMAQNISINDPLTAVENSRAWRSPNGDFAFGFQQLQSNRDHFVLSIWFDKIPDKTLVWYERSSYPVPRGSTLQLEMRDGFVLRDPQGSPLYISSPGLADEIAQGFMQDTGNLLLTGADSSNILWESFRHPSDTILPSQSIQIGGMLISPKTQSDLSQGRFCAEMNSTGNFFFSFKTAPSSDDFNVRYYTSSTSSDNETASNSGFRLQFDETASISVVNRDGRPVTFLSNPPVPSAENNYYRATLDYDGVFRVYYHPKIVEGHPRWFLEGNPRWILEQWWPTNTQDICEITATTGSGVCGFNSICRVRNDRPECECPEGFSLADPNNAHGDCKSDFVQNCVQGDDEEECGLTEIPGVNWPMYDYELIRDATEQDCKDACLKENFCTVAVLGRSGCWKKTLPLTNGRNDWTTKTFFKRGKVITQNVGQPRKPKRNHKLLVQVGSVILGGSILINLFFTGAACFGVYPFYKKIKSPIHNTPAGSNLRCFTYKELKQATAGFKYELGRGSFGIVYDGVMPDDPRTLVAVKKLDRVAQDSEREFRTEVNVIGQIHHKNVVRLLGFCDEGPNRLLVYERMTNGTLASFLDQKPSWSQRTQIARGVARGLAYLHEECITQIIHCDIKPQNILLDDSYTARISDFGLAKLLRLNQSRTTTNIRGTKGYVSPEWFRNTRITTKVDVYSFGVVLLEIISCRKAVVDVEFGSGENPIMTEWAWECHLEGRLDSLVENEEEACSDARMLERFVKVGFWCIQEDAGLRPTMRKACQMLEGTIDVEPPPCPFSYTFISTKN